MPLRFGLHRQILPGVRLNVGRAGPSISLGTRGGRHTIGPHGQRSSIGLPGTGLRYDLGGNKRRRADDADDTVEEFFGAPEPKEDGAAADRSLLRAVVAYQAGKSDAALGHLASLDSPDALWLSGILHLQTGAWQKAADALGAAEAAGDDLGAQFAANDVAVEIAYPITPEVTARLVPDGRATKLARAEALQEMGRLKDAADLLVALADAAPRDPLTLMSLAEIALAADAAGTPVLDAKNLARRLAVAPDPAHLTAPLRLMEGRAHLIAGDPMAAIAAYGAARISADPGSDTDKRAWYEMALSWAEAGDPTRCRQELSALHARDPSFADVHERLTGQPR